MITIEATYTHHRNQSIWISSNEVDETGAYYTERSKSERKTPIQYTNAYIWNLERWQQWCYMGDSKRDTNQRTDFWTLWEKARVGWVERIALKHVYYYMWNRSPVQVRCMRQGAQGRCTGMTLRDGMGREVRAGVQDRGHMYTHGWFMLMYGKNHYNIVK